MSLMRTCPHRDVADDQSPGLGHFTHLYTAYTTFRISYPAITNHALALKAAEVMCAPYGVFEATASK